MKVKLITPDAAHAEAWGRALRSESAVALTIVERPMREVNAIVNGSRPDLLVVETPTPEDFLALEQLAGTHPEVDILLVAPEQNPEFLLRAMRAGVREVLPAPASSDALLAALRRLLRKQQGSAGLPQPAARHGELLALVSCKGGSGATFVAANLAHLLAAGGQRRVALIDMNLQFGDAALFLSSQTPPSHVADVARNIARLDAELLRSAMNEVTPGLWVLAAPEDPAQAADVTPAQVRAILQQAQESFDYVVVDLGRSLSSLTLQVLDLADQVHAVLQLTLPFIRDGKRMRDVFRSLDYPADKIHWIVNRHHKDGQFSVDDLKRTLGIGQVITLPNHYEAVAAAVNQGMPVEAIAPTSSIARALRDLAERIAPPPAAAAPRGWLSGLFRGASA
ncbi:AAA family ATPase [Roseateles sp. DAIF2]|uniref:AAA family ATPase n=1 Tax=Roseateles sp. DAIF2 TaxID=2714952 RepID=UPI0018A2B113|nr:AAA family ATPase [Roseateles sp. DAIF2]QPF73552.1 AAA family ATPase [Roseateles sp. DAIF2]